MSGRNSQFESDRNNQRLKLAGYLKPFQARQTEARMCLNHMSFSKPRVILYRIDPEEQGQAEGMARRAVPGARQHL